MLPWLLTPRYGFALIALASLGLVVASLVLTKALDLAPCPLCIFQRMLYLLLALFAGVAAIWPRTVVWAGGLVFTAGLGGLATAVYQTWLQLFPADAFSCGAPDPTPIESLVYWAGEQVPWLFSAWGDCASKEWTFVGLSLANWSLVAFLGFSVYAGVLVFRSVNR